MADRVRVGLIGASVTGTWSARSHLPALRASSEVELTAVCTTRADSAEAARRAWGEGGNTLAPMPVPERFTFAAPDTPAGEARNVGQMYALFARAIRDGDGGQPSFETAVALHRLIDAIRQASDEGREVRIA
jgi:predicted dehydrogenase